MTGRAFRLSFATASSIPFSPPNRWGTEPASGLTSPAAWPFTTTARSTSNRAPAGLNFASGSPSRRPRRRTLDGKSPALTGSHHFYEKNVSAPSGYALVGVSYLLVADTDT